jgi:hypothetical protein
LLWNNGRYVQVEKKELKKTGHNWHRIKQITRSNDAVKVEPKEKATYTTMK